MGFLYGLCNQLRNGPSAITPLTKEEKIENHFMKGKGAHTSYIQLLQFVLLLLKPYAKNYEAGNQFIECIHRSVEEGNHLDVLMTKVLQCEEADMTHWAKEVQAYGGNGILALDVLMLWQRMEAGDEGLETVINFFAFLNINQEIIAEAADAIKLISEKDESRVLQKNWKILAPDIIKGYFPSWNPDEQMQLEAAVSLFLHDQVTDAYPLFKKLAKRGNRRAMYFMGEYYRFGWAGLLVNEKLGFHYHRLGAEKGEPLCQLNLAYEEGANQEKILKEIVPKIVPLAQAGDIVAEDELGGALKAELGDALEAEFWLKKAIKDGYWRAAYQYEDQYEDDAQKQSQIIDYLETVYRMHGDHAGEAANQIGNIYNGQNNYVKKVEWYKKSTEEGYDWGMHNLAGCYRDGEGVQEDQEQAIAWFRKAYELHGDAAGNAANRIGLIYNKQGNHVKQFEWYKNSAEEGYDWGMYNVACCYRDGEGVQEDREQAIAWFKKAYELHGDAAGDAANQIGLIYNKQGNDAKEFEWMRNGAEEGFDWCMRNLGMCYQCGRGTGQDYEKAREWYQKAIDCHGNAEKDAQECQSQIEKNNANTHGLWHAMTKMM